MGLHSTPICMNHKIRREKGLGNRGALMNRLSCIWEKPARRNKQSLQIWDLRAGGKPGFPLGLFSESAARALWRLREKGGELAQPQ